MRWLLAVISGLVVFLAAARPAVAVTEFAEGHQTVYQVEQGGLTRVTQTVELKNKVSNVYAQRYWLSVGFTNLTDIKVVSDGQLVVPEVVRTQNQTTIGFEFPSKMVLKDSVNKFVVSYRSADIAVKNGSIWEINIPKLEVQNELFKNEVELSVPADFGLPSFIIPKPSSQTTLTPGRGVNKRYVFLMDQLGNKAISAVFGSTQYMKFGLSYFLENANPLKTEMEIALPPDTSYQRIWLKMVDPRPTRVRQDEDGNWLAVFELAGNEKKKIWVEGVARIDFLPKKTPETDQRLGRYRLSGPWWPADDVKIKDLAGNLRSAKSIYQYVIDYLTYDYGKVFAKNVATGTGEILANPNSAICTDYSNLFVTLARAAGIPARELQGYAFTSNDKLRPVSLLRDVLHSWPEYYDTERGAWVAVDPTWGDTTGGVDYFEKLDLNHLTFVVHGLDGGWPRPAGAYKDSQDPGKDVNVVAVDPEVFPDEQVKVTLSSGRLRIDNTGQVASFGQLVVSGQPLGIIDYKTYVSSIPPLGELVIDLPVTVGVGSRSVAVTVDYKDKHYEFKTTIRGSQWTTTRLAWLTSAGVFLATAVYLSSRLLFRK